MTHYVLGQLDGDARDLFFDGISTGAGLPQGSPILLLRDWLQKERAGRGRVRSQVIEIAMVFKAWNAWRDGRSLRRLRWRTEGDYPELFPAPY
jgi:hypothetical protein